jgi:DNA-binding CsgD family transcriptional regulator
MFDPLTSAILLLIEPLTVREQEVLVQLGEGKNNTEIGVSLFIHERTVRTHLYNIFDKMHVETRLEAVLTAQQLGLVDTPTIDENFTPEEIAILVIERSNPGTLRKLLNRNIILLDDPPGVSNA